MQTVEFAILDGIQAVFRCAVLDAFLPWLSSLSNHGEIWIALAVILLLYPKTRRTGAVLTLALLLNLLCCNIILKPLVGRVRPCVIRDWSPFSVVPSDASFPSGHTSVSFTSVGALRASGSRIWGPALAVAVLTAFSRLYMFVHWPTDVLAGVLLGIALGYLAHWILDRIFRPA